MTTDKVRWYFRRPRTAESDTPGVDAPARKTPGGWWLPPICFAVFPLLSLYAANSGMVPYSDLARPLLVTLVTAALVGLLLYAALRDRCKASVVLTAVLFLWFSFGHIADLVDKASVFSLIGWNNVPAAAILAFWCPLFVLVVLLLWRSRRSFAAAIPPLNVVGVVLVALPAATVARRAVEDHGLLRPVSTHQTSEDLLLRSAREPTDPRTTPTSQVPDIYYLILDAYGREDVLQRYYGFDNRPFLDALRSRGFFVAARARPNYGQTICSISSSLDMSYLTDVARAQRSRGSTSYSPLTDKINRNAVMAFLRGRGYRFVAITSGFPLTRPTTADLLLGAEQTEVPRTISPFEALTLNLTPLSLLPQKETSLYDVHRAEIRHAFRLLSEVPELPYRKFVFAHLLAPHPPFVFGPKGESVQPSNRVYNLADGSDFMRRGTRDEYRRRYIDQLRYVNDQVLRTIDSVVARSKVRPIIVVQGDHGPRLFVDWESLLRTDIRETYGNLNAFSLPDGKANRVFYDDITPVNSFRLLLDHYFDAGLRRLPDRSYYSTLSHPYDFVDVTGRLPPTVPAR